MASGDKRPCELTEQEKKELSKTVYPALKAASKKSAFIRILKIAHGAIICSLAVAVLFSAQAYAADVPAISMILKNGLTRPDDPKDFEMTMPDNDASLAVVYKYSKEPTVVSVTPDVVDFDYENGLLAVLKKDSMTTNTVDCPNMHLLDKYSSVYISGRLILLIGPQKTSIADLDKCGIVRTVDTEKKGFSLSDRGFLELTRDSYTVYDRLHMNVAFSGKFMGDIAYGKISSKDILFATSSGRIALMSLSDGKFKAINNGSLSIKQIQYNDKGIFVLSQDNKLLHLEPDYDKGTINEISRAQGKEGCYLMKRSDMMYCDGYLVGADYAYKTPVTGNYGLLNEGMLFLVKDGTLYFVDKEPIYRQSVAVGSKGAPTLCLSEGKAYFHDLDGKDRYFTADGMESETDKYPTACDHEFSLKDGALLAADGHAIYRYAEAVNRSDKAVMLKRVIGQEIYYYFDSLSK